MSTTPTPIEGSTRDARPDLATRFAPGNDARREGQRSKTPNEVKEALRAASVEAVQLLRDVIKGVVQAPTATKVRAAEVVLSRVVAPAVADQSEESQAAFARLVDALTAPRN